MFFVKELTAILCVIGLIFAAYLIAEAVESFGADVGEGLSNVDIINIDGNVTIQVNETAIILLPIDDSKRSEYIDSVGSPKPLGITSISEVIQNA